MIILLMFPFLFGNFVQKWYIPRGMTGECGRILISDADRDGNHEFYIRTYGGSQRIYIYELHLPNTWEVDSFPYLYSPLIWDTGDFDTDGLADIAIEASATQSYPTMVVSFAESPDSFSCPTQEVWRDTVGFALVQPISIYDVDGDGLVEIFKLGWMKIDTGTVYYPFGVYESISDNQYDTVFMGTGLGSLSSTIAFGNFDSDDFNEFVIGNIDGEYQIWECLGDNDYQLLHQQQLPTLNITDCFSVPDADGDGKMEFVIKGFVIPTARIHAFIFEATGDNTYEIIKYFDLPGGDYYGGYSEAGDVDGDSIPEIVLEARQNVFIIKGAGNDSFYVWDTLPGNWSGSSVRVFDVDDNGLSEVVISGNNTTRIFEYEMGINETQELVVSKLGIEICPNPFRHTTGITCQLPHNCSANLQIYDVAGKLVRVFCLNPNASCCTLSWDGSDGYNRRVPSGVYFLRLQAKDYSTTEKLLLIR